MIEMLFGLAVGCVLGAKCHGTVEPVVDAAWGWVRARVGK